MGILSLPVYERLRERSGLLPRAMRALTRWSLVAMAFLFAAAMYHLVFLLPGVPPARKLDGWREMGRAVGELAAEAEKETGRKPLVVGADRYHIAVEAAFYGDAVHNTVGYWGLSGSYALNFRYWVDLEDFRGADLIYILRGSPGPETMDKLRAHVETVRGTIPFSAVVRGREADRFTISHCGGYKPPDKNSWE